MSFHLYKRLLSHLKPYLSRLYLAIFFSVIVGIIATSPVPIIQKTFDQIFVEKDYFMLGLDWFILPIPTAKSKITTFPKPVNYPQ